MNHLPRSVWSPASGSDVVLEVYRPLRVGAFLEEVGHQRAGLEDDRQTQLPVGFLLLGFRGTVLHSSVVSSLLGAAPH